MTKMKFGRVGFGVLLFPLLGAHLSSGCGEDKTQETTVTTSSSSATGGEGGRDGSGGDSGGGGSGIGGNGGEGGSGQGGTGGGGGQGGSAACGEGDIQSCYSGPAATKGVGTCKGGEQVCQNGMFGTCTGEVLPAAEACDGLDNDCDGAVDDACVGCGDGVVEAGEQCDDGNTADGDGCSSACLTEAPPCAHDKCDAGSTLDAACDPCVSQICEIDAYCCDNNWDGECVNEVASICGLMCGPAGPVCGNGVLEMDEKCDDGNTTEGDGCSSTCEVEAGACAHDKCVTGTALNAACDSCVTQICDLDDFCCTTDWDDLCVADVQSVCGIMCGPTGPVCGNGVVEMGEQCDDGNTTAGDGCSSTCQNEAPACPHDKCATGSPLDPSCDACAAQICEQDDFCCTTVWDTTCVDFVQTVCGVTCP